MSIGWRASSRCSASLVQSGRTEPGSLNGGVHLVGSVDGLLFNQDKFSVTAGRMANPSKPDEVVVTETAATTLGLRLGQTLTVAFSPASRNGPERRVSLRIVGIGLLNREVVEDQIARFPTYIIVTPALTRSVLGDTHALVLTEYSCAGGRFRPRCRATVHRERALLHRL